MSVDPLDVPLEAEAVDGEVLVWSDQDASIHFAVKADAMAASLRALQSATTEALNQETAKQRSIKRPGPARGAFLP